MGRLHFGEASDDLGRKRRGFLRLHVDVQRHVFRRRRHPALGRVEQLLEVVHALGVVVQAGSTRITEETNGAKKTG